jgi:hypothetical protein
LLEVLQLEAILSVNLGSGTNKVDSLPISCDPNSGAKPLQDPTSYNELMKIRSVTIEVTTHCLGALLRQPEELPILTGLLMSHNVRS